jgi:protein SCO1/2
VDHTAGNYLFDPRGRLRLYVRHGETPERMAQDIKRLLAGE